MDLLVKEDIEKDYIACIGEFLNAKVLMNDVINIKILEKDSKEEKELKQARINGLAMYLGRLGEMAFKYLLKTKQVEINPKITYDQFSNGQRIDKMGTLKNFKDNGYLSEDDFNDINNTASTSGNMKFHDFMYLELIFQKLVPSGYKNFLKLIDYTFDSQIIDQVIDKRIESLDKYTNYEDVDEYRLGTNYLLMSIFPKSLEVDDGEFSYKLDENVRIKFNNLINTAKKNGDLFTRLRYFSNHINDNDISKDVLKTIYEYISILIEYIKYVHSEGLYADTSILHGKKEAIKYKKLLNRSEQSINYIFNKYKDNVFTLEELLFSGYTLNDQKDEFNDLKKLFEDNNIEYDENKILYNVVSGGYRPDVLKKFFEKNIFDLHTIDTIMYENDEENGTYLRTPEQINNILEHYVSNRNK